MVGTVRRPKQRRQPAPRGGHIAHDAAGMDFDAYEDAANQPMVRTLCSQKHKVVDITAYMQSGRLDSIRMPSCEVGLTQHIRHSGTVHYKTVGHRALTGFAPCSREVLPPCGTTRLMDAVC